MLRVHDAEGRLSLDAAFVSATKGLEPATHLRMSEVLSQVINSR